MMLKFDDVGFVPSNMRRLSSDKSLEQTRNEIFSEFSAEGKPSVLIFGSDKEIKVLLKTFLDLWNYDSEEAESIEEVFHLTSQKSFDLVLMDIKLRFSHSLTEMRMMQKFNSLKNSPFILISGHIQRDVRTIAIAAGASDYFVKPINLDLLEETIKLRITESNGTGQDS